MVGDLMKNNPFRKIGVDLSRLEQMPGNGFPFTVGVCCQVDLFCFLLDLYCSALGLDLLLDLLGLFLLDALLDGLRGVVYEVLCFLEAVYNLAKL